MGTALIGDIVNLTGEGINGEHRLPPLPRQDLHARGMSVDIEDNESDPSALQVC